MWVDIVISVRSVTQMAVFEKMIDWEAEKGVFAMKTIVGLVEFEICDDDRDTKIDLVDVPL